MNRKLNASRRFVEKRLGVSQNRRVETFGEPAVDQRKQIVGFSALALITSETSEAGGGA